MTTNHEHNAEDPSDDPSQNQSEAKAFWQTIGDWLLNPKLTDRDLEKLRTLQAQLPTPIFWLLGKAQSGKTSIIHALTGNSRATIGNGIRPCTKTAYVYDFPNKEQCLLKFLDTRGLGEVNYDPKDDIALFEKQAHVLIVVLKALDHAQHSVIQAVREITHHAPQWPIIVVQTTLHEGYPDPTMPHALPYPYHQPESQWHHVPPDLARSLLAQRKLFNGLNVRFVAIDFTLPEDGYDPPFYGLDALWQTLSETVPLGWITALQRTEQIQQDLQAAYSRAIQPHLMAYSIAAGSAGAIPIPFVDIPLVTLIQAKLFHTIASIYNQELTKERIAEISSVLGTAFLSNLARRQLVKLIPVYGSATAALLSAAVTYALGQTVAAYFWHTQQGKPADSQLFQKLYAEHFAAGQVLLKEAVQRVFHKPADKTR